VGMKGAEAAEAEDRRVSKEKETNSHLWVCAALDAVGKSFPSCRLSANGESTAAGVGTGAGACVATSSTHAPAPADGAESGRDSPLSKRRCAELSDVSESSAAVQLQKRSVVPLVRSLLAALQSSAFEIKAAIANAIERLVVSLFGCHDS
jgi:hypothetical protein